MENIKEIGEKIHQEFEVRTRERDQALLQARRLTRHCANAIRAVHRSEDEEAQGHLRQAQELAATLKTNLANPFPELYFAGYTQDAIKEYAEASITYALVHDQPLPFPDQLVIEYATYLNGLA